MIFTDTGARPVLTYLGEFGTSGLLAGSGLPLPGWCPVSVDSGKLVFWPEGLGRKVVDLSTAAVANLPGPLKTDSGKINLQAFSSPFDNGGVVCILMTHFRGRGNPGDPNSPNDNTRDLFLLSTPFAVGGGATPAVPPVDPPAPPGASVDLSAVVRAIEAARGPLDGRDAETNTVAGVHNGVDAIYDRLGIKAGDSTAGQLLREIDTTVRASSALLSRPPESDFGLPEGLAKNLGTDYQRYLAWTIITVLEYLTNLPEFPRADGGTILRT